jgi:uncharacterized membrane protein YkvI
VLQIIPFMIAGAFVPTWTSRVIILLATRRPVVNGLAFVAGNFAYRFLLGLAVLYMADVTALQQWTRSGSTRPVTMFIAALLLFSLAFWLFRQNAGHSDELPGWMKALERVHPALSFVYGVFLVALPGVQYVYFIGALGVLLTQTSEPAVQVVGLLIYCMFVQLMLLAPVVAFARYHDAAQPRLDVMKEWLTRYGNQVTAGLLCLFGVYALVLAVMAR